MTYDNLNDDERDEQSRESIAYITAALANLNTDDKHNELIHHLTREITTLIEYRGRINIARSILTAGKPTAARLALMALDGTSIDQIMREAITTDEAG